MRSASGGGEGGRGRRGRGGGTGAGWMEARRRVKGVSLNNQVSDSNNSSRFCQCFHVVFVYFSLLCYGV